MPYEISFDNDISIVKIEKDNRTRMLNDLFLRFKNHCNFKVHFCNLHSPQEKANVEKAIHTLRMQVFSPIPIIEDFDTFNKFLLKVCDLKQERNRKGFYKTSVKKMFETDRQNFLDLPEINFEVCTTKNRRCNEMGCVVIQDKHFYYLSPDYNWQKSCS